MTVAVAILLAAGRGERLGGEGPKGLVEVAGRPLVAWAVEAVEACPDVRGFVVAVPAEEGERVREAARSPKLLASVPGGALRQDSVRNALAALPPDTDAVLCHDVARPFARPELFSSALAALAGADGGVPVIPAADTPKRVQGGEIVATLERSEVAFAQTPQAFRLAALVDAHRRAAADGVVGTDDASLLERAGYRVVAVPGDADNFKVTVPADLRRAETLVAARG